MLLSAQGFDKTGARIIAGLPAWYIGGANSNEPSLALEVLLNGSDASNTAPGVAYSIGETLAYDYAVTNTGPFTLKNVRVFSRYYQGGIYNPPESSWSRACTFAAIEPFDTVSCTEQTVVPAGESRRDISAQTYYQSTKINSDKRSYFIGQ